MGSSFKMNLINVFSELNDFMAHEDNKALESGEDGIGKQEIHIVGSAAWLLADLSYPVTAVIEVHLLQEPDALVFKKLEALLTDLGVRVQVEKSVAGRFKKAKFQPLCDFPYVKVFYVHKQDVSRAHWSKGDITERVLQRLSYEKLLITTHIRAQKKRITLNDILEAGRDEPLVYAVLPAILLYNSKIIYNVAKDLKRYPKIQDMIERLFDEKYVKKKFFGIEVRKCQSLARNYKSYLDHLKSKTKYLTKTFRFSQADMEMLKSLTKKLETGGFTQTLRLLLKEKTAVLHISS